MRHLLVLISFATLLSTLSDTPAQPPAKKPMRREVDLTEGSAAPDFSIKDLKGEKAVKLSDLRGKPVVLIFGSCTWPPFVKSVGQIEKLYAAHKTNAHIFVVYIREAHPNERNNQFQIGEPKTLKERQEVAGDFAKKLKLSLPILVDAMDDPVDKLYAGWPDRIYVIDRDGNIALKGDPGPGGFSPSVRAAFEVLDKRIK